MKWMTKVACITCICALLSGCGNRLSEIKDAASGINSAANSAASAVSRDVHAIRALDINYKIHRLRLMTYLKLFYVTYAGIMTLKKMSYM